VRKAEVVLILNVMANNNGTGTLKMKVKETLQQLGAKFEVEER